MATSRVITMVLICAGAAVLAASLAATRFLAGPTFSPPPASAPSPGEPNTPRRALTDEDVVCFGHLDAEFGLPALRPGVAGRVLAVDAREGDSAEAGKVLVRLDDRAHVAQADEAQVAVDAAKLQRDQAADVLPKQHALKQTQLATGIKAARSRLRAAGEQVTRKRELVRVGQGSETEVRAADAAVDEARELIAVEEARLAELKLADPAVRLREAELAVKAAEARLERARRAVAECRVVAPSAGRVLRVMVNAGDLTAPDAVQPAVVFQPAGVPVIVRAEVEQERLTRVAVGQPATAQDDNDFNAPAYPGTVKRISDWVARRRSVLFEPGQVNDVRTAECIVTLDGTTPLKLGQRVRVIIRPKG